MATKLLSFERNLRLVALWFHLPSHFLKKISIIHYEFFWLTSLISFRCRLDWNSLIDFFIFCKRRSFIFRVVEVHRLCLICILLIRNFELAGWRNFIYFCSKVYLLNRNLINYFDGKILGLFISQYNYVFNLNLF